MPEKNIKALSYQDLLDTYAKSLICQGKVATASDGLRRTLAQASDGFQYTPEELKTELLRRLEENEKKIKQLEDILKTTQKGFAEYVVGVQSCPDK